MTSAVSPVSSIPSSGSIITDDSVTLNVTKAVRLFSICAAFNSCNLGFDIGVNTSISKIVQLDLGLSNTQLETFMGSINMFAIVGAFCASYISDRYGRLQTLKVAAIGFILGLLITVLSKNFIGIMFGRVIVGLGVGVGFAIDPIYIAEISPAGHRGELVTWSEIATNIGIVLGFLTSLFFSGVEDDGLKWRVMISCGMVFPILVLYLTSFVMPESPRWLVQNKRYEEAKAVLRQVYPSNFNIDALIAEIEESIEQEKVIEKHIGWGAIFMPSPAVRRMLLVGVGVSVLQQITGIDAIQYYLVIILDDAGISDDTNQAWCLVLLGVLKLFFLFACAQFLDIKGRRPLLLTSLGGMIVSLLMISLSFSSSGSFKVVLFGLAVYLSFFSLGMGPMGWLIPSEVFFTSVRAKAMSVAVTSNRVFAAIMAMSVLSVEESIGWGAYFLILAIVCILSAVFVYFLLPETKEKHLEDMVKFFAEISNDTSVIHLERTLSRQQSVEPGLAREEGIIT